MNAKVTISNRAGATFPVRKMNFDFNDVPEYWMSGSPGLTHFLTALSALFPAGERFFIDSVRAVRDHPAIKDNEQLQKEIRAFIGQEAMHTHEHIAFNASAQKYGHDVARLEQYTDNVIQMSRKLNKKVFGLFGVKQEMLDLMGTTALEHFTATIASQLLQNENIQALMGDSTMSYMWFWHAIEENEHKAVAYDVFEGIFGRGIKSYLARTSTLTIYMAVLFLVQSYFVAFLLAKDKQLNLRALKDIYTYAYSPSKGIITGMAKEMRLYFKFGFHPNDLDTKALLTTWKLKLGL